MSVIVKGMDMPKNCAYCPLSKYRNTSLGQILDCKRIGTVGSAVRGTHDVLNHRHPNCPLVDSPEPHWIPVDLENNEPPLEEWVLVSGDGCVMQDCIVKRGGKKIWYHGGNIQPDDRYMPLPEPYKEVTE